MHHDVPDSSQECPQHPRLQARELGQIKSDFENFKAQDYLHDFKNNLECIMTFLTPLRNVHYSFA